MSYVEHIKKLYRPPLEENITEKMIYLNKNEPPFSAFSFVSNLITDKDIQNLRTYPDPYKLYVKLSNFVGVDIEELLITQGSEQAIEFVFRLFLDPDDEVVYLNPSFAMFDVFAYQQQANIKYIEFEHNMTLSVSKIVENITKKTKLFVLANPNNPTGTAFSLDELEIIAQHTQDTNTVFLLDEAYFYFYEIDSLSLIKKYKHIIITRTFSKAFGIAGARVGYALSNKINIELLRKLKPIDEINELSNVVVKKVIDNAEEILEKNITQVDKWKKFFKTIHLKDIKYIDTEGNFILLSSQKYEVHKQLFLENNIIPKMDFPQDYLKNCFRFSVLNDEVMYKIVKLLG